MKEGIFIFLVGSLYTCQSKKVAASLGSKCVSEQLMRKIVPV
jgi:hypothetical protein